MRRHAPAPRMPDRSSSSFRPSGSVPGDWIWFSGAGGGNLVRCGHRPSANQPRRTKSDLKVSAAHVSAGARRPRPCPSGAAPPLFASPFPMSDRGVQPGLARTPPVSSNSYRICMPVPQHPPPTSSFHLLHLQRASWRRRGPRVYRAVHTRPYERRAGDPIYRPLRIFTLDPAASQCMRYLQRWTSTSPRGPTASVGPVARARLEARKSLSSARKLSGSVAT